MSSRSPHVLYIIGGPTEKKHRPKKKRVPPERHRYRRKKVGRDANNQIVGAVARNKHRKGSKMYGEEVVKAAGGPILVCTKPFFRGVRIFEILKIFLRSVRREREKNSSIPGNRVGCKLSYQTRMQIRRDD